MMAEDETVTNDSGTFAKGKPYSFEEDIKQYPAPYLRQRLADIQDCLKICVEKLNAAGLDPFNIDDPEGFRAKINSSPELINAYRGGLERLEEIALLVDHLRPRKVSK